MFDKGSSHQSIEDIHIHILFFTYMTLMYNIHFRKLLPVLQLQLQGLLRLRFKRLRIKNYIDVELIRHVATESAIENL